MSFHGSKGRKRPRPATSLTERKLAAWATLTGVAMPTDDSRRPDLSPAMIVIPEKRPYTVWRMMQVMKRAARMIGRESGAIT
jgi:hypothetical protein